ncbi:P-loop containing nucleoside triphosphate hydrolase protein [Ramicandelaber brevisporus]|nr:P-loop containing nucleoside triphosphate hydrolase protein [Ramicandelaber brevisporus]
MVGLGETVAKVLEAIFLGYVVRFFQHPEWSMQSGFLYALGLSLSSYAHGLLHHYFFFPTMRTGLRLRTGLIGMMYKKCLSLPLSSTASSGALVNMISNDVQPFETGSPFFAWLLVGPIELAICMYFLYDQLGVASFAGIGAIILMLPVQGWFSRRFAKFRSKTVARRDERIKYLSDLISGIQLVKLSAWEKPLEEQVNDARNREMSSLMRSAMMKAFNMAFFYSSASLVSMLAVTTLFFTADSFKASQVFTAMALFNVVRLTITNFVPTALEALSEARVSSRRIVDFMLLPELKPISRQVLGDDVNNDGNGSDIEKSNVAVEITGASFAWEAPDHVTEAPSDVSKAVNQRQVTLHSLNVSIRRNEVTVVVGPVGSGKTSLAMAILGELTLLHGTISCSTAVEGKPVGYAAQSAWIFGSATIRDNILFGLPYDEEWYNKVVYACALVEDFRGFEQGDLTELAQRGSNLSGGQRARIGLARAVYNRDAELYILDDPLSAVDPHVARHLFRNVINGVLKGKTRLLITHQLQFFQECESALVLDQGCVVHSGPVADILAEAERIVTSGTSSNNSFLQILREYNLSSDSTNTSEVNESPELAATATATRTTSIDDDVVTEALSGAQQRERVDEGSISYRTYIDYFLFGSTPLRLAFISVLMLTGQGLSTYSDYYLSRWSSMNPADQRDRSRPATYAGIVMASFAVSLLRAGFFFHLLLTCNRALFRRMLSSVLRAPITFFQTHSSGVILNRMTKDVSIIDELMPLQFFDALQCVLTIIGVIIMVCIINPWVIISLPFLAAAMYVVRLFYMAASRQIKRIESVTRSPVYALISSTLEGSAVIRAFASRDRFLARFLEAQNENARAFFTFMGMARWVGLRMDTLSATFLTVAAFATVGSRSTQQAGLVGLSLSFLLQLVGMAQWALRQSIEVSLAFVSVDRITQFTKLPSEAALITDVRPPGADDPSQQHLWPSEGVIEFRGMYLRYPGTTQPVLRNLTLTTRPHENVAIVGRTGAGKSSALTSLFRLIEPYPKGSIVIDGIDITRLGLYDLRSRLSIIPQEPVLFKGTLRFNLDPFGQYSDDQIWDAIDACDLRTMIEHKLPNKLETEVAEGGKNFSTGERQLLSMCRAVLRRATIIVMDESSANIDMASDRALQKSIQVQFANATVLTIAHRLDTIIGYDRVLVLDHGVMKEWGEPWELLQVENGWFAKMVAETGPESERELRAMAERAYKQRHGLDQQS